MLRSGRWQVLSNASISLILLIVGCTSPVATSPADTGLLASPGPSASALLASPQPAATEAGATQPPCAATEEAVMAQASKWELAEAGARFSAESCLTTDQISPDSVRISVAFPITGSAQTTYTLSTPQALPEPTASAEPGSEPVSPVQDFVLDYQRSGTTLTFRLSFTVPADEIPGEIASVSGPISDVRIGQADATGAAVVLDGLIDEGVGSLWEAVEKAYGNEFGIKFLKNNGLMTAIGSIKNFIQAMEMSGQYQELMDRLVDLRRCVRNPTTEAAKHFYADPNEQMRALARIDATNGEILEITLVRFVAATNAQASGLAGKLSVLVGPITSWVDSELKQRISELLSELERSLIGCRPLYGFAGTYPTPFGAPPIMNPVAALSCTGDFNGPWLVLSYGNPTFTFDFDTLLSQLDDPSNAQYIDRIRPGQPFGLTGETSLQGVIVPSEGPPPTLRLDVTWPGRGFSDTQSYDLEALDSAAVPNACAPGR
jgi:hypothetical protein